MAASTVSRAFARPGRVNAAYRRARLRGGAEIGYRSDALPGLTGSRTRSLALVVTDITNPFYSEIIRGAHEAAGAAGYTILLSHTQEDAQLERDWTEREMTAVEGVLLDQLAHVGQRDPDAGQAEADGRAQPPDPRGARASSPTTPRGMRRAVEHLAELGHDTITYVAGPESSWADGVRWHLRPPSARTTLSSEAYRAEVQSIFTQTTLLFVVIGSIAYALTVYWCREQVVRTQPRVSVRETWDTLRHNKPLGYLCAASFFYLIGLFAVGGASAFYAQYVLGDIKWLGPITLVNTGISIVCAPFIPKLVDRFGKKTLFQYCGLFTVVGGLALFFLPTGVIAPALIFLGIKGIGSALINTVMFGLEADTVEYGEWKSGQRSEGATYAVFSFTRKITQSIGGSLGAAALAVGGYLSATQAVPNPVQPESAILAIKATMGLIPAVAAAIAMLIFWKYPLSDQRFREIRNETEARKAAQGHLIAPDGHVLG